MACRTERVERGVIALGDVAALRCIEWRRGNERDPELVGQRGMAAEVGEQRLKKIGPIGSASSSCFNVALQSGHREGEPGRGGFPCQRRVVQRPPDIGHRLQCLADPLTAERLFVQPLDQRQPRFGGVTVGQRRRQIGC